MIDVVDALGHGWTFETPPRCSVSLVPSTTESLFELGAADRLVARTDYCIYPPAARALPSVGGTKNFDLRQIRDLQPDLILANQEENARAPIEALLAEGWRVLVFFPRTVRAALADLRTLAAVFGASANDVLDDIEMHLAAGPAPVQARVFVPIWNRPLMTFNADTVAADLMRWCGFENVFNDRARRYPLAADTGDERPVDAAERDVRYPRVTVAEVAGRQPDWVWLPDEPYVWSDVEAAELAAALRLPRERVRHVDGSLLFWHGTRLARALREVPKWL
jgi:ABC-type Fe3+-hydroxamate transport system substrate-binding protein